MYIRWTNFSCPNCGRVWARRIVSAPRVGRELHTCSKCGKEFRTHDLEWLHMTRSQRMSYLFSEWLVGWLIFYALFFIIVPGSDNELDVVLYLLGVGVVMFSPYVLARYISIRRSNNRVRSVMEQPGWGD